MILRESTEGLFAARGHGTVEDDQIAKDTMVITRKVSERLFDFAPASPSDGAGAAARAG